MASKETGNSSENNFTMAFPSNTSHKSLSTKLLAPCIYRAYSGGVSIVAKCTVLNSN